MSHTDFDGGMDLFEWSEREASRKDSILSNECSSNDCAYVTGKCLWRYAIIGGRRVDIADAKSGDKGLCPLCGEVLVARKGTIRTPHWWHRNGRMCDSWYEPMGNWHRFWQNKFPKEWQEVSLSNEGIKHIADIYLENSGYVIECQYSSIPAEKIREREDFYEKMIWIVNGTRLNRDKDAGDIFKAIFKYHSEGYYVDMEYECCAIKNDLLGISRVWRNSGNIVIFDFDGTFDTPSHNTEVYCLLPGEINLGFSKERVLVKLSQFELVTGLHEPVAFLNKLLQIGVNYANGEKCKASLQRFKVSQQRFVTTKAKADERAKSQAQAQEHSRLRELAIKTSRNPDDLKFENDNPPLYAITLDWLDLWSLIAGHERFVRCDILPPGISSEGTIALHNRNECEEFVKKWLEMTRKYGLPNEGKGAPPAEPSLRRHCGAITALARYKITVDGGYKVLVFSDVRRLQGHSIKGLSDRNGIWFLPDKVAGILENEQDIILGNMQLSDEMIFPFGQTGNNSFNKSQLCPYCRAKMIKLHRRSDGGLFWGCPNYPRCRGARPYRI